MLAISSSEFLKEFTIYCDKVNNDNETIIVARSRDRNIVVLSLEEYNSMKKQIFLTKNKNDE